MTRGSLFGALIAALTVPSESEFERRRRSDVAAFAKKLHSTGDIASIATNAFEVGWDTGATYILNEEVK